MREVGLNGGQGAGVAGLVRRLPDGPTLGSVITSDPELEASSSSATGVSPTVGWLGGEKLGVPTRLGVEPLVTTWDGAGWNWFCSLRSSLRVSSGTRTPSTGVPVTMPCT